MPDILSLIKALCVGEGTPHDIGIRLLIMTCGGLAGAVSYYVKRDVKKYGEELERLSKNLMVVDTSAHSMNESIEKHKHEISTMLFKNVEELKKEFLKLRESLLETDSHVTEIKLAFKYTEAKLAETNIQLHATQETRSAMYDLMSTIKAEMYDFVKKLSLFDKEKSDAFGKIIRLEEFEMKYKGLLSQLEKAVEEKNEMSKKKRRKED